MAFASKSGYTTGGVGGERGAHDVGSNRGGGESGLNSRGMTSRDMHAIMDARYHGDMQAVNQKNPVKTHHMTSLAGALSHIIGRMGTGIGLAYNRGGLIGPGGVINTDRPPGWTPPNYMAPQQEGDIICPPGEENCLGRILAQGSKTIKKT